MWNTQGVTVAIGIVGVVLMGCGMSVEEKEAKAVATPRTTASDLPWWDMSAEDSREPRRLTSGLRSRLGMTQGFIPIQSCGPLPA